MTKKTYSSSSNVNVRVLLNYGTSAQIVFAPQVSGGSVFVTTDAALQSALESHAKFGKLFELSGSEETATAITHPKVTYDDRESNTGSVLTFQPQKLTEQEREQARKNIGAAAEPSELENVVKYSEQSLSSSEQGQARTNIGAQEHSNVITSDEMAAWLS